MAIQNESNLRLAEFTVDLQGLVGFPTILFYCTTTAPSSQRSSINDGTGGWFFWDSTSILPQDGNVNVVDPFNGKGTAGRWRRATAGTTTVTLQGDVTGSGTGTVVSTLANTGVVPGTYNNLQVDAKGRALVGTNVAYISGNQTITFTSGVAGSGSTTVALTISSTAVSPGAYPKVQVGQDGRVIQGFTSITLGSDTFGNIPITQLGSGVGATAFTLLHGNGLWSAVNLSSDVTGTLSVTAFNAGSSASTSTFLRGDGVWQVPPGASGNSVTTVLITSPDIVVSPSTPQAGAVSFAIALTTSAAVVGSWKSPNITVSGDGRINVIANADDAVPLFFSGTMANSTPIAAAYVYSVQYQSQLGGSVAFAQHSAANSAVFTINKISNGAVSNIGNITFTSSQSGTFTFNALQNFTPGNLLQVVSPASADGSLSNVSITFLGTRF